MLLLFFIFLAFWIGIGSFLLFLKNRPTGKREFLRTVNQRVYEPVETINVTLKLVPPVIKTLNVDMDKHDVILVLDHSGSMGSAPGSPLRESVRAMENFVKQLPASYSVGLVIFDHEAQCLCQITDQKKQVLSALKTIAPGGATELHLALNKCREILEEGEGARDGVKKTIILLSDGGSDRKAADEAAKLVRDHESQPTIISVGFGPYVDEDLMKSIASTEQDYIHIETADLMQPLFERLLGIVSGKTAHTVLVNEQISAPRPFSLETTGEIYPVGIHETKTTHTTQVSWFLSLLEQKPEGEGLELNYRLQPDCLGWHSVASTGAEACWKGEDDYQETSTAPAGPKVLVLPNGFAWTWPLLNPLFWLIFGRFFKCHQLAATVETVPEELSPLPEPELPKPLLLPDTDIYTAKLRHALVIGLGELGEWSLTRFKWQLQDRLIDKSVVDLLVIQDSGVYNRPTVTVNTCALEDAERVILQPDLRPYLETLRNQEQEQTSDSRNWVPWRQWLRETRPLSTYTDDRRKARLALLLQPEAVEERIKSSVERVLETEGIVIIVGEASDAEASGMVAEVAHICASAGAGVTAILVPPGLINSPDTTGMVRELELMLTMRGENITSDRGGKSVSARQLFDRILVANQSQQNAAQTSESISHLLWSLLAYPELLEQMPEACYQVEVQGQILPQASLWHWVRQRTLSDLINQHWLGASITANQVNLPDVKPEAVQEYVRTFWDESDLHQRYPTQLLKKSALVVRQDNPLIILEEALEIPFDKPYHEQRAYCNQERIAFIAYLEAWCYTMLETEFQEHQWGLLTLLEAVREIEQDFEQSIDKLNRLSVNTALVEPLSFIASIYTDYQVALGGLRSSLEHWIAALVGWQPGMKVNPLPQDFVPLGVEIEKQRQQAESDLPFQREILEPFYQNWYKKYGNDFLQQLRFRVKSETQGLVIKLQFFQTELNYADDLSAAFNQALEDYKELVFQWPTENWVTPKNSTQSLRLGKFSATAYPQVNQVINQDDPFLTAALSINPYQQLADAFRLDPNSPAVYAWPEQANAARIADKIRYLRQQEPQAFSAKAIAAMRDTRRLQGFFGELATAKVSIEGQTILLNRANQMFEVGSTSPARPGIVIFEDVVRQVVTLGVSLTGEILPLPEDWLSAPEEAVNLVEQNPLVIAATESPEWPMWQDVILGLALDRMD